MLSFFLKFLKKYLSSFKSPTLLVTLIFAVNFYPIIRNYINIIITSRIENPYLSYILSIMLPILVLHAISMLVSDLVKNLEKILDRYKQKSKAESTDSVWPYYGLSPENLELFAKRNGIYNNVPTKLWIQLDKCIEESYRKNFSKALTIKDISRRNKNMEDLFKVSAEIILWLEIALSEK